MFRNCRAGPHTTSSKFSIAKNTYFTIVVELFVVHTNKNSVRLILTLFGICLFSIGCADKELHPNDVEYRIDDNGTELLYQIGREYPFAYGERAFIVDHFKNGKIKFKIEFQNGKKDGNFTFWQDNGLLKLNRRIQTR